MSAITVVDSAAMDWVNGLDVVNSMTPEWRDHLGDIDAVRSSYQKYSQKTLYEDEESTRRVDIIRCDPGYADVTAAYHDSVEETYILAGCADMSNEGEFVQTGYFWRPPGWIHRGRTSVGFTSVLFIEGKNPDEGSGPASRRIRSDDEMGVCGYAEGEMRPAPRGWIKCPDSQLLPWEPGPSYARSQAMMNDFGLDSCDFKVLSRNVNTGAQTMLVRLREGYKQARGGTYLSELMIYVISGAFNIGGKPHGEGTFMHLEAGGALEPVATQSEAILLVKCRGLFGFVGY